jgi:WD40 repeat protein
VSAGYSGTVQFTSTDSLAHLPTISPLTNGTGNFSATLENAGPQIITTTDTVKPFLTGASSSIAVSAAAALAISSGDPPSGIYGVIYGPSETEFFKCFSRTSCTQCGDFRSQCGSLPTCNNRNFPCIEQRPVSDGFPLAAIGGVQPYGWSAPGLPLGLSVNSQTGEIFGTPTSPGSFNVPVTVGDSGTPQVTTPMSYTIMINNPAPPIINGTPAPPSGAVNLPYSFAFTASSAAPPLMWRVMGTGTPPPGTILNPDGMLSGTPTATGTSPFTLIAEDSFKQDSMPQNFTIQIFAHGFKPTGDMAGPRIAHTATLLSTGKVLVAGGTDGNGMALASAELYDPTTGTFSATGSMATARHHFAATLLCDLSKPPCNDKRVLVTGGLDVNGNPLMSAELYDPNTGTFSPTPTTGSMQFVHASHTATLLNTGKVLIIGWGPATAELFDPSTGTFKATGSMLAARVSHTATLLKNGKVLVAAGIGEIGGAPGVLPEAELYDPVTGSFSQTTGHLANARQWHTANLLADGRVLLAGGLLDNAERATATAELFDPTTQMFTATTGSMTTARAFQTATVLNDGTVQVTGGDDGTGPLATVEVYDPTAETFSAADNMGATSESHTATLLNDGTVLVTGGIGDGEATAELYH